MRKNKWNTMYELSVEAEVSEQVKEAIYKRVSDSIVYEPHEAMNDVFRKKVTYNGGGAMMKDYRIMISNTVPASRKIRIQIFVFLS
jgi:actin-like ATPase involved in cell morphogenesis